MLTYADVCSSKLGDASHLARLESRLESLSRSAPRCAEGVLVDIDIDDFEAEVKVHACYMCGLVLLYMWPNTEYVSSYYYSVVWRGLSRRRWCSQTWPLTSTYVASYYYICGLIRLIPLYRHPPTHIAHPPTPTHPHPHRTPTPTPTHIPHSSAAY
jgi:hypothetical protein